MEKQLTGPGIESLINIIRERWPEGIIDFDFGNGYHNPSVQMKITDLGGNSFFALGHFFITVEEKTVAKILTFINYQ